MRIVSDFHRSNTPLKNLIVRITTMDEYELEDGPVLFVIEHENTAYWIDGEEEFFGHYETFVGNLGKGEFMFEGLW